MQGKGGTNSKERAEVVNGRYGEKGGESARRRERRGEGRREGERKEEKEKEGGTKRERERNRGREIGTERVRERERGESARRRKGDREWQGEIDGEKGGRERDLRIVWSNRANTAIK